MSFAYTTRVWKSTELKRGKRLVMLALAHHADDSGLCWPGMPLLMEETQLTYRQVRRVINDLVADGLIAIEARAIGRSKKPCYQLFPGGIKADTMSESELKADIMSEEKRTLCPTDEEKADICDSKSGHFAQGKADISDTKADISDTDYSHARIESPVEPTEELTKESSSSADEEEEPERDPLRATWLEYYRTEMPEKLKRPFAALATECGESAVLHSIRAGAKANARTFAYVAKCARNYIPPAPEPKRDYSGSAASYAVDLPGVYALPAVATPEPAKPLPPPLAHDDLWAVCLSELRNLPGVALDYLAGSRLEEAGEVDGVPLYRVVVGERAAAGLSWLTAQAGPAIRRKLGGVLRKPVLIEIVAMDAEGMSA